MQKCNLYEQPVILDVIRTEGQSHSEAIMQLGRKIYTVSENVLNDKPVYDSNSLRDDDGYLGQKVTGTRIIAELATGNCVLTRDFEVEAGHVGCLRDVIGWHGETLRDEQAKYVLRQLFAEVAQ